MPAFKMAMSRRLNCCMCIWNASCCCCSFDTSHCTACASHPVSLSSFTCIAAIFSGCQMQHTSVPVQYYVSNTCSWNLIAKKLYRLLRAGNIQIYHLRAKQSDSERRGAQTLWLCMCHIAQKVIPSVNHSTQVTSVYRDPAASLLRQRESQVTTYAGPSSCDQCCTAAYFHCTRPDEGCFHSACSISLVSYTNTSRLRPGLAKFLLWKILLSHGQ